MKTNELYVSITAVKGGTLRYARMVYVSLMIVLLFASLPVASAFAAPARVTEDDNLAQEWQSKLRNLRFHSLFYEQVRLYPADYEHPEDLARAYELIAKYSFALRRANTIVFTSAGFDINGHVTNEKQAIQSLQDLAGNLQIMRAIWMKLDERDYTFHRLR